MLLAWRSDVANRRKSPAERRETLCISMPGRKVQWVRNRGGSPSAYIGRLIEVQMANDLAIAEEEALDLHARAGAADRRVEAIKARRAPVVVACSDSRAPQILDGAPTEPPAEATPPKPSVAMR